jgi:hypothetical protein
MVRKHYKNQEDAPKIITTLLYELLGLDGAKMQAKKQPLTPLFESEPALDSIAFADDYTIDSKAVHRYAKECWFVDYVTQLFPMLFATTTTTQNTREQVRRGQTEGTNSLRACRRLLISPLPPRQICARLPLAATKVL